MNTDVECTSHWKKIGKNSWRGFVHLNTEEKKQEKNNCIVGITLIIGYIKLILIQNQNTI